MNIYVENATERTLYVMLVPKIGRRTVNFIICDGDPGFQSERSVVPHGHCAVFPVNGQLAMCLTDDTLRYTVVDKMASPGIQLTPRDLAMSDGPLFVITPSVG